MSSSEQPLSPPPALTRLAAQLPVLAACGGSAGLFAWALLHTPHLVTYAQGNVTPSPAARVWLLALVGAGAALFLVLGLVLAFRSYQRLEVWTRRLLPLLPLGALPFCFAHALWRGRELDLLLLVSVLGLLWPRAFEASLSTFPREGRTWPAAPGWLAPGLVAGLMAAFTAYFTVFSWRNHESLRTSAFDLGIEDNLVWHASRLTWPPFHCTVLGGDMTHLGLHQTWISYLIAVPYRLAPGPYFLLALQAAAVALAALPLYLLARPSLGRAWAVVLVALFLLYAPLERSILYDFHYQPLFNVLGLSVVVAVLAGRPWLTALLTLLTLSLREDMGLLLAALMFFLVATGQRTVTATVVGAVGFAHFVVLKLLVMPLFAGGTQAYIHQYAGLLAPGDGGFGGVLRTVALNPPFTLHVLAEPDKLLYVLQFLAPLAFLPLRFPAGWLLTLPGFFFTLLSTRYPPLVSTAFQYNTYWVPFLFLGLVVALARMDLSRRRAALVPLVVCSLILHSQFGAVLNRSEVYGGFEVHHFELREDDLARRDALRSLLAQIPPDDSVVASERLVPHISTRAEAYALRNGLSGATWLLSDATGWELERPHVRTALGGPRAGYGVVGRAGTFFLARKGADTSRNAEVLSALGL